ncbi:hypothetical protein IRJ41_006105 [Triplophysa rosa]|uniref:Uncharacterized protein n=1 Tax=Triplophysa rosa TaxID=992332 RepID=A0A9W7T6X4_TRIRA|nr:hypothetical protein IRJ41_006105 [Triplophysa rosa]
MEQRIPVRLCNITASSKSLSQGACLGVLIEAYPDPQEISMEGEGACSAPPKGGDSILQEPNNQPPDVHHHLRRKYTGTEEGSLIPPTAAVMEAEVPTPSPADNSATEEPQTLLTTDSSCGKQGMKTKSGRPVRAPSRYMD